MERRSARAQSRYYALRLTAILGGVAIPVLVTWPGPMATAAAARGMAAILGVTVAAASAVEGLFRFGERWRHYRRTVEALKAEFWLPAQLAGPYRGSSDRRHAFPAFVERVEAPPSGGRGGLLRRGPAKGRHRGRGVVAPRPRRGRSSAVWRALHAGKRIA